MGQRMLDVAVVGAETLAGRDLIETLLEESFPMERPALFTIGEEVESATLDDEEVDIVPLEPGALASRDLVFLLPGARPDHRILEEATRGGGVVLDAAGILPDAPLIFPGLNDEDLDEHEDALALSLPTPLASLLAAVLVPLDARARVKSVDVVALRAAAGAGNPGLDELSQQTIDLLSGRDPERNVFSQRLAFNLVPMIGVFEGGATDAEKLALDQLGRLLGRRPEAHLVCAWAPLFHGATVFFTVRTEKPLDREAARAVFREAEGLAVLDDPEQGIFPMPMLAVGDDRVHVGRFVRSGDVLRLVATADELRFGVASPLVALARELLNRGRLSR